MRAQRFNGLGSILLFASAPALLVACSNGNGSTSAPHDGGVDATSPGDAATADAGDSAAAVVDAAPDPTVALRASCAFAADASVSDTIGDPNLGDAQKKIGHLIVMMKENRSFDEMLGGLAKAGKTDVELPPAGWSNPTPDGGTVPVFHATNTCYALDPEHQGAQMLTGWNDGGMNGFVINAVGNSDNPVANMADVPTDGHFVMAGLEQGDLPFYYFLARTFALADHYHAAALAGTWANRLYVLAGSSYGVKNTGTDFPPNLAGKLVTNELDAAHVTWAIYSDSTSPFEYTFFIRSPIPAANVHPTAQFFSDLSAGTLPSVVFVEGDSTADTGKTQTSTDEHPPADLQVGEAWSKTVYDAVTTSSIWYDGASGSGTALLWTYDENGSFADHVPPPPSCPPADVVPSDMVYFSHYGPRVPFVVVSPYARAGYVSHATHSHTSITRLIEAIWKLGALTARDANSDALLDMFDFSAPALKTPPAAPAAGSGGCSPDAGP
jgi:phospholipase C